MPPFPSVSAEEKQVGSGMKSAIPKSARKAGITNPHPFSLPPPDVPPQKCGRWTASRTAGSGAARTPGNSPRPCAAPSCPRLQSSPRGSAAPRWTPGSPRTAHCPPSPSSTGCEQPAWPGHSHSRGHSIATTSTQQSTLKIHLLGWGEELWAGRSTETGSASDGWWMVTIHSLLKGREMQGFVPASGFSSGKVLQTPRSPSLHNCSHFLEDSSHFLMVDPECEDKRMYPIGKLGENLSPLSLFHLLPSFPHLLNHPGWVCLTTFRVFGAQHQKKTKQEHISCTTDAAPGPSPFSLGMPLAYPKPFPTSTLPQSGHPALPCQRMPCPLPGHGGPALTWRFQRVPCRASWWQSTHFCGWARLLSGRSCHSNRRTCTAHSGAASPASWSRCDRWRVSGWKDRRTPWISEGQLCPAKILPVLHPWAPHSC